MSGNGFSDSWGWSDDSDDSFGIHGKWGDYDMDGSLDTIGEYVGGADIVYDDGNTAGGAYEGDTGSNEDGIRVYRYAEPSVVDGGVYGGGDNFGGAGPQEEFYDD